MSGLNLKHSACLFLLLTFFSGSLPAAWDVAERNDISNNPTQVAFAENEEGYTLEIYRDAVGAVRSRFTLSRKLDRFADRHCPTFQVDSRLLDNRSINDAPCITDIDWSEFVLGYIDNYQVQSAKLNALVNGRTITFRFLLNNGGYEETSFSLEGSKRATLTVLGSTVTIEP